MKMLDPGSVVRESEFANAAATGSFGERFQAAGERIVSGRRLSEEMRADFVSRSKQLMEAQNGSFENIATQFRGIAERRSLNPDNIVVGGRDTGRPGLSDDALAAARELRHRRGESQGGMFGRVSQSIGISK